ncbi:hypothetical protein [Knoellia aerolata]|uniref:hypothetical protein n=1 Tax=Knoellia aerolata TaxID=442954 RepID=UPI000A452E91|nr:hypothetical protein [Knoellia aerolata]
MSNFHKTKKSAAVLKHAILDQYATPFASKTGSTSIAHRVAFIDGYAGPGRSSAVHRCPPGLVTSLAV